MSAVAQASTVDSQSPATHNPGDPAAYMADGALATVVTLAGTTGITTLAYAGFMNPENPLSILQVIPTELQLPALASAAGVYIAGKAAVVTREKEAIPLTTGDGLFVRREDDSSIGARVTGRVAGSLVALAFAAVCGLGAAQLQNPEKPAIQTITNAIQQIPTAP